MVKNRSKSYNIIFYRCKILTFYAYFLIISLSSIELFSQDTLPESKLENDKEIIHDTTAPSSFEIILSDLKGAGSDFRQVFEYLITPSYKHIAYPLAVADFTYVASSLDEQFRVCPCQQQDIWWLRQAGEARTAIILPSAIYLSGLIFRDEDIRITGRLLFESMLLSGVVNSGLKFVFGRARPSMNLGHQEFYFFQMKDDFQSMPSGHTCAAFTTATLLAGRIDNSWVDAGLYLIAAGTAFQRIMQDRHWFSDVVLGGMIGFYSSRMILSSYADNQANRDKDMRANRGENLNWAITPYYDFRGAGLNLRMSW